MKFEQGDLIETLSYKGGIIYGIVLETANRFNYAEVRILTSGRIMAVVHDGRKGGIKLIQRVNDEKRITRKAI